MILPEEVWTIGSNPDESSRDCLVRFWLSAPSDQVQSLLSSPIGEASKVLIARLAPDTPFSQSQVDLRNSINERLSKVGLQQPLAPQLLLAVFLYSPPGLMQIANPDENLPSWLSVTYKSLYEAKPEESEVNVDSQPVSQIQEPPVNPDFGDFPSTLSDLNTNRVHLNRILGLSNLYYIDPDDKEIANELIGVRSNLVDLIFSAQSNTLEAIWGGDFGDRYWAMVRSGIQTEDLNEPDKARKLKATEILDPSIGGGFVNDAAVNAFLVAMLYYLPGTMQVKEAENKLPSWLFPHYQQIFIAALNQKTSDQSVQNPTQAN